MPKPSLINANPISNKNERARILNDGCLFTKLLIGFALVSEGFGIEIPKGYIYFSMAFSMMVSVFQMRAHKNNNPVTIHEHYKEGEDKFSKNVL